MDENQIKNNSKKLILFGLCCVAALALLLWGLSFYVGDDEEVQEEVPYVTIMSWNIEMNQDDLKNDTLMDEVADIMDNYDIIALQGLNNFYENNDSKCDLNSFAQETPEYQIIKNSFEEHLPDNYRIQVSEVAGDRRYAFIWNNDKVRMRNNSVWEPDQVRADAFHFSNKERIPLCYGNRSIMYRDPYLRVFSTDKYIFSLLNVDVMSENVQMEHMYLDQVMQNWYQSSEILLSPIIMVGDFEDCKFSNTTLRYSQYRYLFEGRICDQGEVIYVDHMGERLFVIGEGITPIGKYAVIFGLYTHPENRTQGKIIVHN